MRDVIFWSVFVGFWCGILTGCILWIVVVWRNARAWKRHEKKLAILHGEVVSKKDIC